MSLKEAAFHQLGRAVRHLFHQLRAVAESVTPPADGFTASHRAVLESLSLRGSQTVPALARARPVTRQHIQVLVNDLTAMGFVETRANPAHKRSPLVALTAAGTRRFAAVRSAESAALKAIHISLSAARLEELARELEVLSGDLGRWLSAHQVEG